MLSSCQNRLQDLIGKNFHILFDCSIFLLALVALIFFLRQRGHFLKRIMKQERTEHKLQMEYNSVLETTSDAVISVDEMGKITLFNPGAQQLFGYTEAEILGTPFTRLCPEHLKERQAELREKVIKLGSIKGLETQRLSAEGKLISVEMTLNQQTDAQGNIRGLSAIIRDITERKKEDKRREALLATYRLFSQTESRNKIYQKVAELLSSHLDFPLSSVELYDPDSKEMVYMGTAGFSHPSPANLRVPIDQTISGTVAQTGQVVMELNASERTEYRYQALRKLNVKTFLCVPIIIGDKTLGTMAIADSKRRDEARQTLDTLQIIANQLAQELDRRDSEEALRENEEQLLTIFQAADDVAFIITDLNGKDTKILSFSPGAEKIFGYQAQEIIGQKVALLHPSDQVNKFPDMQLALNQGQKGFSGETTLLRKSGEPFPALFTIHPHFDTNGKLIGTVGVSIDLTDRKRIEEGLRRSEERFRKLLAISPAGIYQTDPDGSCLYVNETWCRMAGITEAQALGEGWKEAIHPGDRESVIRAWEKFIHETGTWAQEYRFLSPEGNVTWIYGVAIPLKDDNDNTIGYLGINTDITERKLAEEEKTLLEKQYQQAQKIESIGRLAGGVAHDLNNLLAPILGYSEMLREELRENKAQNESIDEILQAGLRARDLVRQLLAFSRKQTLEYNLINLNNTISSFEKLLRHTIREDIELIINLSPDIQTIKADNGQIEQVIMNLAVNAADAMPEGGELVIETSMTELDEHYTRDKPSVKPGQYVTLSITDTGCGIDESINEHLFEPFFSTKGEKGTGLGLATVYGITKQHGGDISIYSEPGKGACFSIYLPVAKQKLDPAPTINKKIPELHGTETILLVEDNEQVKRLAFNALKLQGYTILAAENGTEALALLDTYSQPIHLLLSDVIIPGMNGKELFDQVSAKLPKIKVLYMSGYPQSVISQRGVLDEGVNFIQKPFGINDLLLKVREAIEN